ncbi:MAG: T9SS type A sorting domain-containing protein, partial [Fidelibacterota bacterium]
NVPLSFQLKQNFPNPFNPYTEIPFTIPFSSNVKLTIYNINGQEVAVLVNEVQEVGNHIFKWNTDNLGSGVYFIKLDVSDNTMIRRGILLK